MNNKEYFIKRSHYYQKYFGLLDFYIYFDNDCKNPFAKINYNLNHRNVYISYNEEWITDKHTPMEEIDRVAFHEICELNFAEIDCYLSELYNDDFIDMLIHSQIKKLENILWPLIKDKKD